jgi:hypothetical protein
MKPRTILLLATMLVYSINISYSQDSDDTQLLWIHEDLVIPSESSKYMEAMKGLKQSLSDNSVQEFGYNSFWRYDNSWIHVRPIQNLAELDKNPLQELIDKMGEDNFQEMFSKYNGTYNSHRTFVAVYHPSYSYKPELLEEEGNYFREWMYLYYHEKDHEAMMGFMKEWKELYESKGIDTGYTIYTAGLGHYGPVIVVHTWGKDQAEYAKKATENEAILREEATELWERSSSIIHKQEMKRGYHMADVSYIPQQ